MGGDARLCTLVARLSELLCHGRVWIVSCFHFDVALGVSWASTFPGDDFGNDVLFLCGTFWKDVFWRAAIEAEGFRVGLDCGRDLRLCDGWIGWGDAGLNIVGSEGYRMKGLSNAAFGDGMRMWRGRRTLFLQGRFTDAQYRREEKNFLKAIHGFTQNVDTDKLIL